MEADLSNKPTKNYSFIKKSQTERNLKNYEREFKSNITQRPSEVPATKILNSSQTARDVMAAAFS